MDVKLKKGIIITVRGEGNIIWSLNDTDVFTDFVKNEVAIYNEGEKLYFPKNHFLSGCGFPENMFQITPIVKERKPRKSKKNEAMEEVSRMMEKPMNTLPPVAIEYLRDLASRIGFCGEVCVTAYANYCQAVLKLKCSDPQYKISEIELKWFKDKKYY